MTLFTVRSLKELDQQLSRVERSLSTHPPYGLLPSVLEATQEQLYNVSRTETFAAMTYRWLWTTHCPITPCVVVRYLFNFEIRAHTL